MTTKQIVRYLELKAKVNRRYSLPFRSQQANEEVQSGLTIAIRTDDAERLVKYLKRKGKK